MSTPRTNLLYGRLVDTKTAGKTHAPAYARVGDGRMNWFESKNGIGSVRIRFSVNDFGSASAFRLFGGPLTDGAGIFIEHATNKIRYKNTNGTLTTETVFDAPLVLNVLYVLDLIKIGETCRAYLSTAPLPISSQNASGLDRTTTSSFILGNTATPSIFTVAEMVFFNVETDRKAGSAYMGWIEQAEAGGNYVHPLLQPYCVGHFPCQERTGNKMHSCVEQYNPAKVAASIATLEANVFDLNGYIDTELGMVDKTTQTSVVNLYDRAVTNFWNVDGTEKRTGLPDLKSGLYIGLHTVTYPAGSVVLSLKGYNILAYKLKSGESLTPREELALLNNEQYANPAPVTLAKMVGYWQHNAVYDNAGTPSLKDLVGTAHISLSSYTADELTPAHMAYAFTEIRYLRYSIIKRLKRLGTIERFPAFFMPTATVDTDKYVTLDTTGTTSISLGPDLSGFSGRHEIAPSKALAPLYDSAKRAAKFTNSQCFNRLDINQLAGTMLFGFHLDTAVTDTYPSTIVGTFHGDGVGGATTSAIAFGNFGGGITGETFSAFVNGGLTGVTDTIPVGYNILGFYISSGLGSYFDINGVPAARSGANPPGGAKITIQTGNRISNGAKFTGYLYWYIVFSTVLDTASRKEAYTLTSAMKSHNMLIS
jgi:hypothetical protein